LITLPLLLAIAVLTTVGALVLFPNRAPAARGDDVTLDLVYSVTTHERPDVEVIIEREPNGARRVHVDIAERRKSKPTSFELIVGGVPVPSGNPKEINFSVRPKWHHDADGGILGIPGAQSDNWIATASFAGDDSTGFFDNGETFEGVVTAATAYIPLGFGRTGDKGRLNTVTYFDPINPEYQYEWSGRTPDFSLFGLYPGFVVMADEQLSSTSSLDVTGYYSVAATSDNAHLFIAGALVALAGGAVIAAISEAVKYPWASVGQFRKQHRSTRKLRLDVPRRAAL
jgi:hypothetical protein